MQPFNRIRARYAALDFFHADAALAALAVLVWALESFLIDVTHGASRPLTFIVGAVAFAAIAWRRRNPLAAITWFVGVSIAQSALDTFYFDTATMPFVVLLLLSYSVGRHEDGRSTVIGAVVLFVGINLAIGLDNEFDGGAVPFALLFVLAPMLCGRGLQNRARLQDELRDRARHAEDESRMRAERAVEVERSRIAGELQAVVANGVSAMVVQAEAVPTLIGAGDRDRAGETLAVIEETGRDTLAEMRRLLGVLRHDGDAALLAPQPSLDRLGELIDRAGGRGVAVELRADGGAELAHGVELTAYRTVETALESAANAGARRATVTVRRGERDLELEIADDRSAGAAPDPELVALRSRLEIYDGHLAAGPGDAGYTVRARLPREPG